MARFPIMIATASTLLGCATPDISQELTATQSAFADLRQQTGPTINALAAAEYAAAELELIAAGKPVVETRGTCQPVGAIQTLETTEGLCRLASQVVVTGPGVTATQVKTMETALEAYFAALVALNDASSVDEIRANSAALTTSIAGLAGTQSSPSLTRLASRATANQDRISGSLGLIFDQYRHQALVTAVRRGDREIAEAAPKLYGYYQTLWPQSISAARALTAAERHMVETRARGASVAENQAAIAAFRTAFDQFQTVQNAAPATWFLAFRQAHAALLQRLQNGGDVAQQIAAIEALIALKPTPPTETSP